MCPSVSRECRALSFAGAHTEEQRAINFGEAARNRPAHSLARTVRTCALTWLRAARTPQHKSLSQSGRGAHGTKVMREKNHRRRLSPPTRATKRGSESNETVWLLLNGYPCQFICIVLSTWYIYTWELHTETAKQVNNMLNIQRFVFFYNLSFHTQVHFLRSITKRLMFFFTYPFLYERWNHNIEESVQIRQQHFEIVLNVYVFLSVLFSYWLI